MCGFRMLVCVNSDISLDNIAKLIFVMMKSCVFFEARTELLSIISTSIGFKKWSIFIKLQQEINSEVGFGMQRTVSFP
jgi:hypothetical protein